jgi:hypothetical protein
MTTPPDQPDSPGGAPAEMPPGLWEAARHGTRGTIPPWVSAAPDATATAPSHIGQVARRAAQVAAVAGAIGGGIGLGIGLTEGLSHSAELAHTDSGAAGHASTEHISTERVVTEHLSPDHGSGSLSSFSSGDAPGPSGPASEGVTLHTSGPGDHVLHTTFQVPGHAATGGEDGPHGAEVQHDGLTIDIYQDVVVNQGADGMYSVDAVEYVVVRDEHGHSYVFSDDYHTVVPDPPGQETDLVIHENDHVQVTEHPDGSFSVAHPDNSISVTVGADGDGSNQVTVTQSETVQIDHDHPNASADGHDTSSLTEIEDGATTSSQTEVVSADAPLPPGQEPAVPVTPGDPQSSLGVTTTTNGTTPVHDPGSPAAPGAPATPATSGHGPTPPSPFSGLHGGPAGPGDSAAPVGHFPGGTASPPHSADGSFSSASSSAPPNPFEHPAPEPPADASSPDTDHSATLAGHDQPALDEPEAHHGGDLAAVDPAEPGLGTDTHSAGEYEAASSAHPDSLAGSADAPEHDPGTIAIH